MMNANLPAPIDYSSPRFRFEPQDKVTIYGTDYAPKSSDRDGYVLRRVDAPDLCESFTREQIETYFAKGELQHSRGYFLSTKAKARNVSAERLLSDLSEKAQEKVLWRKALCDGFLRLEAEGKASRSDESMSAAIEILEKEVRDLEKKRQAPKARCGTKIENAMMPSPTALRKWLKRYDAAGTLALHDGYYRSGNGKERFSLEERALFREFAERFASRLKPTKAQIYVDLCEEIDDLNEQRTRDKLPPFRRPSYGVIEREIAALDPFHVVAGREGTAVARKRFHMVSTGIDVTRPLERVEMDEWKVSLQALLVSAGAWERMTPEEKDKVERKVLWVSAAIDVRTRCILAIRLIENPSGTTAVSTLEMAVGDKTRFSLAAGCQTPWDMVGIPETVVTDSGPSYISQEFCAAVADLEAEHLIPPAGLPQMRGTMERTFRTKHQKVIARFDGRTFENTVAKGEYDAEANAVLTVEELGRILVRWVADVYHNTPHAGLKGETPRQAWLRLVEDYAVIPPPSPDVSRHIFGATVRRRITNKGIRFLSLPYQSLALQKLRRDPKNMDPLVRIDPLDLSRVSVRMKDGWLTVPCQRAGMDGVTAAEWIEAGRLLKRKYAEGAARNEAIVFEALREIRQMAVMATERAGIGSPVLTAEDYGHEERHLFRALEFDRPAEGGPPIIDGTIVEETEMSPNDDDAAVDRGDDLGNAADDDFGLED